MARKLSDNWGKGVEKRMENARRQRAGRYMTYYDVIKAAAERGEPMPSDNSVVVQIVLTDPSRARKWLIEQGLIEVHRVDLGAVARLWVSFPGSDLHTAIPECPEPRDPQERPKLVRKPLPPPPTDRRLESELFITWCPGVAKDFLALYDKGIRYDAS